MKEYKSLLKLFCIGCSFLFVNSKNNKTTFVPVELNSAANSNYNAAKKNCLQQGLKLAIFNTKELMDLAKKELDNIIKGASI